MGSLVQREIRGAERSVENERYRAKVLRPGGSQRNAMQHHTTPYRTMCFKLYVNLGEQKGPGSIRGFTRATQFPPRATQRSTAQRYLMRTMSSLVQHEIRGAERSVKDERYRAKVLQPRGSQRNAMQRSATPRHIPCDVL